MGVFSTFSLIKQKEDAILSISNNTDQLGQTIEKILRVSMLKNRRDDISLAVNNIVGSEGIKSVRILNHKGLIEFSSRRSEVSEIISKDNQLCMNCHNKKDKIKNIINHFRIDSEKNLIYNSIPIYNAPSCYNGSCHSTADQPESPGSKKSFEYQSPKYSASKKSKEIQTISNSNAFSVHDSSQTILGFIEIEVSIKKIISNLENTRLQLFSLTVLFALIASVITYFSIRYFIGKPVKNLVEGTLRVAQGDFKHEIPPGKAELGLLSESFNKMQKQLVTTQAQLIESERLASVGKLADEIANEINNPLTGIIVYSESLIEDADNADNKKSDYEIIRQEALKIRENIRNILSLTGQEKPDFKIISIGRIIKHATSVVKKFSNFRNIQIITGIPNTLPDISADPGLMEQVFLNLLLISAESMQTGGILNISAYYLDDNKEIEITFMDTGRGIPENVVQKVFNPEYSYSLESFEKVGISLAVCKDIIEMHKGKMFVNSNEKGASVTIKLPV